MKNVLIGKGVAAFVAAPVLGGMEQLAIRLPQPLVQALSDGWIPAGDAAYSGRRSA